jgi:dTDP-4-dehydrorhamnose 3,5-epimerase
MNKPTLIEGGLAVDDRGEVRFVNEFNFKEVKRFYVVSNYQAGFVRAWHAHRSEAKYVLVSCGAAIVGAVKIEEWQKPSPTGVVHRFVLSAAKPNILYIPPGYANGFMSLTTDTQVFFFSTATIEESRDDDMRFDARYWDIWTVVER